MRFIIQVLFVAICVAVFPGLSANPVENREQDITMRVEDKWCLFWGVYCSKATVFSPECQKCLSHCETTSCAKNSGQGHPETAECRTCSDGCRNNVCKL